MKLSLIAILIYQSFSFRLRGSLQDPSGIPVLVANSEYYGNKPIVYSSNSGLVTYPLTQYPAGSVPTTYSRKGSDKVNYMNELRKLKQEIWGDENFNTEQIRSEAQAFDARWLVAQLKITRVLELEDYLTGNARKSAVKIEEIKEDTKEKLPIEKVDSKKEEGELKEVKVDNEVKNEQKEKIEEKINDDLINKQKENKQETNIILADKIKDDKVIESAK